MKISPNVRLAWKYLTNVKVTNIPTYCKHLVITDVKSVNIQGPGVFYINIFTDVINYVLLLHSLREQN